MSADWPELELRPVRPIDRDRVLEMAGDGVAPDVFDRWVADPGGQFEAGEVDGVVVAVHRLRPMGPGVVLYEGLLTATERRRQGIGREMLRRALDSGRDTGFREMRLVTGDPATAALVEQAGFRLLVRCDTYSAPRVEGVDQPRLGSPDEADRLATAAAVSGGVLVGEGAPEHVDADLIRRRAAEGLVRVGPSGRALALLTDEGPDSLWVGFVAGEGAALEELLFGLRVEADARSLRDVRVRVPQPHPSSERLEAAGYQREDVDRPLAGYVRPLT